jgi:hypothetical protein
MLHELFLVEARHTRPPEARHHRREHLEEFSLQDCSHCLHPWHLGAPLALDEGAPEWQRCDGYVDGREAAQPYHDARDTRELAPWTSQDRCSATHPGHIRMFRMLACASTLGMLLDDSPETQRRLTRDATTTHQRHNDDSPETQTNAYPTTHVRRATTPTPEPQPYSLKNLNRKH